MASSSLAGILFGREANNTTITKDGIINIQNVTAVQQWLAGIIDSLDSGGQG